ncbi:MAG TPA: DDE-type integrase/transposase/recombinase [Candidatus Binataceae bacterium]|nr:DDE-type integrase/transposase/recombinase [Candidatus Binataceae bacterium]
MESSTELRDLAHAMLAQFGRSLRAPRIREAMAVRFPEAQLPSLTTIKDYTKRWRIENPALEEALNDPDRFKAKHRTKIAHADTDVVRLAQLWEIDGTTGDIMLKNGRRYTILTVIDIYSRRSMFLVAPSESASAAARLICKAITAWGVPEEIAGDNGAGFVSEYLQRLLADLGIIYTARPPFRPELKSHVERMNRTLSHEFFPMLPGFTGHSVAEQQARRARQSFAARFGKNRAELFEAALTAEELQIKIDIWADKVYGERPHKGLAGRIPNAVAAAWRGGVRFIDDRAELELLAQAAVKRKIVAGRVTIEGVDFIAEELSTHCGEQVTVFPHPSGNMGLIYVFRETRRGREALCVAVNPERAGIDRDTLAITARRFQNKFINERRAETRRLVKRINPASLADEVLKYATENAPTVVPEHERISYQTPALTAAREAIKGAAAVDLSNVSQLRPQIELRLPPAGNDCSYDFEAKSPAEERFDKYLELKSIPPEQLSEADARRILIYETGPEFEARKQLGLVA